MAHSRDLSKEKGMKLWVRLRSSNEVRVISAIVISGALCTLLRHPTRMCKLYVYVREHDQGLQPHNPRQDVNRVEVIRIAWRMDTLYNS